jgi:hypothetical protein
MRRALLVRCYKKNETLPIEVSLKGLARAAADGAGKELHRWRLQVKQRCCCCTAERLPVMRDVNSR